MKKIPTLFKRVFSEDHREKKVLREVAYGCEGVLRGEYVPTVKWDGACCMVKGGEIWKRYDAKIGKDGKRKEPPEGAVPCQDRPDEVTGHWPHWVKCEEWKPEDRYFLEALENTKRLCSVRRKGLREGTYEAVGPAWRGNPYNLDDNRLMPHGWHEGSMLYKMMDEKWEGGEVYFEARKYGSVEEMYEVLREFLKGEWIEGIVWWGEGIPLCKLKRSDFGFEWPIKS